MREIKFRAWDEANKKMFEDVQFIKSGDEGNDWICFTEKLKHKTEGNKIIFDNPYFSQQVNLMQYTGLKDKNGKEVYEGDIITYGVSNYVVIFHKGCFCIKLQDKDYHIFNNLTIEIIGNIHENPELLKNKP